MTTARIRWGILGAGSIARRFAEDMRYSKTGTLVAVAARTNAKAERFVAQFRNVRPFDDYEALAQWADVDAVYVATPNTLHAAHCLIAINAGKAVLCEKPFASSAQEARDVACAAAAANVFCMEAMWTRFLPCVAMLQEKIDTKALGEIVHLEMSLGFPRREMLGDPITDPVLGGGVVPDLGVYGLSIAEHLLGPFILASSQVVWSELGSSRTALMVLRHQSGRALSVISISHDTQLANTLVISGTKARATLEAPFIQARRGHIASVGAAQTGVFTAGLKARVLSSPLGPTVRRGLNLIRTVGEQSFGAGFQGSGLQFEIDEVGRCLADGVISSARMPLETSILVLAALDSVQDGRK